MCDTCNSAATEVLKMDFYSIMSKRRDEILADPEMAEVFGEAFEELIQNYALFMEKVFQGQYEADSIERRQAQWEERLATLVTQVEHGPAEEEEQPEQEPTPSKALFISMGHAKKSNPFSAWANVNKGGSPSEG